MRPKPKICCPSAHLLEKQADCQQGDFIMGHPTPSHVALLFRSSNAIWGGSLAACQRQLRLLEGRKGGKAGCGRDLPRSLVPKREERPWETKRVEFPSGGVTTGGRTGTKAMCSTRCSKECWEMGARRRRNTPPCTIYRDIQIQ